MMTDDEWEAHKADMDAEQTADHGYHLHTGEPSEDCPDCQEQSAELWTRMARL